MFVSNRRHLVLALTLIIVLVNQVVRLCHTQIRHQHTRLHIHGLLHQLLVTAIGEDVELHIAILIIACRRQRHAEVRDLNIEQLRLLGNGVEMRRRHEIVIHRDHTATRDQIDHIDQQVIIHTEQDIRLVQSMNLTAFAHRINLQCSIGPDLRLIALPHLYRDLLLEELLHFLHVADLPDTLLLITLIRQMQHDRCRWDGELLTHSVMTVGSQTRRVRFIQTEMDRALLCVLDGGGDGLLERR